MDVYVQLLTGPYCHHSSKSGVLTFTALLQMGEVKFQFPKMRYELIQLCCHVCSIPLSPTDTRERGSIGLTHTTFLLQGKGGISSTPLRLQPSRDWKQSDDLPHLPLSYSFLLLPSGGRSSAPCYCPLTWRVGVIFSSLGKKKYLLQLKCRLFKITTVEIMGIFSLFFSFIEVYLTKL